MNATRQRTSNDDATTRALHAAAARPLQLHGRMRGAAAASHFQGIRAESTWQSRSNALSRASRKTHKRRRRLARRLARALVSGASTDGDSQSFSAIWAARAAERACVACCVLQRADRARSSAGVPAALVYALRCAVEASDARAQPDLYAATIVALLDFDNFPRQEPDEETGYRGLDEFSRLEISNQLVQAGFLQVTSAVAMTRGEETSGYAAAAFSTGSRG